MCVFLVDDKRKAKSTAYVLMDIIHEEGLYVNVVIQIFLWFENFKPVLINFNFSFVLNSLSYSETKEFNKSLKF